MGRGAVAVATLLVVVLWAGSVGAVTAALALTRTAKAPGRCTDGGITSSLAVSRYDPNTLRVRFRIANSTRGTTWQIFGSDNGTRIFAVTRVVSADRSALVRRLTRDRHGLDKVKVAANNLDTGETCSAAVMAFEADHG